MATKKVRKFGAGGDILTGVGAVLVGKALYDKYKEGKGKDDEESEYAKKAREFRDKKAADSAPEPAKKEEDKPMSREEYLSKKTAPIKETGTFAGPDTAEPDLEYKGKKAAPAKKATSAAPAKPATPVKKAEPAAPAKKTETEGSAPKDKSGYSLPSKNVTSMIEGKGSSTEPKTSGGARNRAGVLVNPSFITPKKASEEEVSEARASLAKRRAEQSRSFKESPLMKAISGGGSRADFYRKKREQEDAEKGMKKGGKVKKYASGGTVKSSASSRADGIAQRGKTRGRVL
jgi:hypothetical protein